MPLDQEPDQDLHSGLMSFGAHLDELRKRLIWATVVPVIIACAAFTWSDVLVDFIKRPLMIALAASGQPPMMQVLSPSEMVVAKIQLSIWAAVLLSLPWILWQAWMFISPGLYTQERRYARFLLPLSTVLVVAGLTLFYLTLPLMLQVLMDFAKSSPRVVGRAPAQVQSVLPRVPELESDPAAAEPGSMWMLKSDGQIYVAHDASRDDGQLEVRLVPTQPTGAIAQQYRLSEYMDFVIFFGLAIAVAFQMPVAVLLLGWLGILDVATLRKYRRHAILFCAIAAAVITPTIDPLSMIILMIPLYMLYEFGIVLLNVAPARAVAEGGVVANALGALVGRRKYRPHKGDEGEE